jgi:hypothetical protein
MGFFQAIGTDIPTVFWSFSGSVVAGVLGSPQRVEPWKMFTAIVGGTFCGMAFGPVAPDLVNKIFNLGLKAGNAATFVVGVAGVPICRGMMAGAQRFFPRNNNNGNNRGG